jgi:hypothetical protein
MIVNVAFTLVFNTGVFNVFSASHISDIPISDSLVYMVLYIFLKFSNLHHSLCFMSNLMALLMYR